MTTSAQARGSITLCRADRRLSAAELAAHGAFPPRPGLALPWGTPAPGNSFPRRPEPRDGCPARAAAEAETTSQPQPQARPGRELCKRGCSFGRRDGGRRGRERPPGGLPSRPFPTRCAGSGRRSGRSTAKLPVGAGSPWLPPSGVGAGPGGSHRLPGESPSYIPRTPRPAAAGRSLPQAAREA